MSKFLRTLSVGGMLGWIGGIAGAALLIVVAETANGAVLTSAEAIHDQ